MINIYIIANLETTINNYNNNNLITPNIIIAATLMIIWTKTDSFLTIFKNQVFSLCIPINLNQTAVVLFWLGKSKLANTIKHNKNKIT